jgi:acetoin utilization deacetylase AcuC-like enzyme
MPVPVVYSDAHRLHPTARRVPGYGRPFPEVPDRVDRIRDAVTAAGHPLVPPADHGLAPIEAVHDARLTDHLRTAFARSRANTAADEPFIPDTFAVRGRPLSSALPAAAGALAFDVSCPIFATTWEASYAATQCAVTAAELVRGGRRAAYALVRPPGHHAGPGFHGGFCYTNHAAAAARHLQRTTGGRVAVLDIDYHHGNGTQEVFLDDPEVFVASLHADPRYDYPYYWGYADERGVGTNRNVPLPAGTGDADYHDALRPLLDELAAFGPRFLVLSAGFDLMHGDPVPRDGGFRITPDGLRRIAESVAALGLPTVIVQEGGYDLPRLGGYGATLLAAFG